MSSDISPRNEKAIDVIAGFLRDRDAYYRNAEEFIERGELRKASEMLWGAVTQSVKALAAASNIEISTHDRFFVFLREFCHELGDDYFYSTFVELNDLHRNFYDEFIPKDAFYILHKKAFDFVKNVEEFLRKKALEKAKNSEINSVLR